MLRVFLLAVATLCLLATAEEGLTEVAQKCQDEFKLDEETRTMLNNTKILETNDPKVKCFVKCILMGYYLMNEAGDITLDRARTETPNAIPHFEKCANVTGTDPCDKAVSFQNCLLKDVDVPGKVPE